MASDNMRGALLMVVSMCAFTFNDACMKMLSGDLPLFQAVFLRGIGTTVFLVILAAVMGQLRFDLDARDWKLTALRTAAEIGAAYFFITALFKMPIANVTAILQALPLTVTLAGALFLGEPVGWRRILAIVIGFVGVLLILRPGGADFNVYSLFGLAAVACVTVRDLAARRMSRRAPSVLVALVAAAGVTLASGVASLFVEWRPVSGVAAFELLGAMGFIVFGYVLSVSAMRSGEIGFVTPFRYSSLLAALLLGLVIFGEWPQPLTLLGAGIVVATGLFTLYRERARPLSRPLGRLR